MWEEMIERESNRERLNKALHAMLDSFFTSSLSNLLFPISRYQFSATWFRATLGSCLVAFRLCLVALHSSLIDSVCSRDVYPAWVGPTQWRVQGQSCIKKIQLLLRPIERVRIIESFLVTYALLLDPWQYFIQCAMSYKYCNCFLSIFRQLLWVHGETDWESNLESYLLRYSHKI